MAINDTRGGDKMIKRLICIIVFTLYSLLFTLYSFSAEVKIEYTGCFMCHSAKGLSKISGEGVKESLYINEDEYKSSVHGKRPCTDCHSDIKIVPHQKGLEKVDCAKCHNKENVVGAPKFSPSDIYQDSVHGKALKVGIKDVPVCNDCHGMHNIRKTTDPKSSIYHLNIPKTCAKCHADMKIVEKYHIPKKMAFAEYESSVHGKAIEDKGLTVSAVCTDCHGVHNIHILTKPEIPKTCSKCHIGIYNTYIKSIHGKALEKGIKDAPTCTDCHGEHTIKSPKDVTSSVYPTKVPRTCSKCHENIYLQKKYGLVAKRLTTYMESFHGVALKYGNVTTAECASCHGYHDILPSSDLASSTNKNNLPKTCGKCHPGAGKHFAEGNIHLIPSMKRDVEVYLVRIFYTVFIALLISGFVLYIILDLIARIRRRKRVE